jgi:hypothetical protein
MTCVRTAALVASHVGLPLTMMHVLRAPRVPAITAAKAAPVAVPRPPQEASESAARAVERLDSWFGEALAESPGCVSSADPGPELVRAAAEESAR